MNIFEALLENKKTSSLIKKAYKNYAWKLWSGDKNVYIATSRHIDKLNSAQTFNSFVDSLIEYDFSNFSDENGIEYYNERIASVFRSSGIGYWRRYTNHFSKWQKYDWNLIYEEFQDKLNKRIYKNLKKVFGIDCKKYKNEAAAWMFSYMISGYCWRGKFVDLLEYYSCYEFNNSDFNLQDNFDLAWKIANNTLSMADKAEVVILFNDIKERLIK